MIKPYCDDLGPVNIARCDLSGVMFFDTGGTNGWLAATLPDWAEEFVRELPLAGMIQLITVRLLKAGIGIPPHVDPVRHASSNLCEHRYHVPLVTHREVRMRWPEAGVTLHLETGHLYEVNHHVVHEVIQRAPIDRVHMCIDTVEVLSPCSY